MSSNVEIRFRDHKSLDEVVSDSAPAHLERLDKGHWFLSIGGVQIWLRSKSKISAHCEWAQPEAK